MIKGKNDNLLKDVLVAHVVRELASFENMSIQLIKAAPEMLHEMEKLAQAL